MITFFGYLHNKIKYCTIWKWLAILMPIPMGITHGIMSLGFNAPQLYVNIVQAGFLLVQMSAGMYYMRQVKKGYL